MSRESDLNIRFSVTESEMPLAEQLAALLNEQFSIDRISTSENGYSIEVWNSEKCNGPCLCRHRSDSL